jgi:hypothetical protein
MIAVSPLTFLICIQAAFAAGLVLAYVILKGTGRLQ